MKWFEQKNPVKSRKDGTIDFQAFQITSSLQENVKVFDAIFMNDDTFRKRYCVNANDSNIRCYAFYLDGMVNNEIINESIVKPIIALPKIETEQDPIEIIFQQVIFTNEVKKTSDLKEVVESVLYGDTALIAEGSAEMLIINTKGWKTRGITEPENEKTLKGPKEGFTESILMNTTLLRRRIKTNDLKFKFRTFGTRTNTKVCICYLDSLADKKVLKELNRRLDKIKIDGVLDVNYLEELIKDSPYSPFKTSGNTERADVVAGKLLEGRIAVMVDGSPGVMTLPYLFVENFQADDDYYLNYYFASIGRLLRILSVFITISVPAIYVALISFHKEMIPTSLALSISSARHGVPLPIIVECLVMLTVFEILREAGVRMPSNVGTALSIVGAIVIGQAAVEAKFVSAPMVIIVALTGITGLMIPKMKGAIILCRTGFVILSAFLGLYGFFFGALFVLVHLMSMNSFGLRYMSFLDSYRKQEIKDIYIRMPWWDMETRPKHMTRNLIRKGK